MDKTAINEIVQFLKLSLTNSGIVVDSIILFGSALSGNMNENSDIDLIIISPDFKDKNIFEKAELTMKSEWETLKKYKIPMDILNFSPEEYQNSNIPKFYNTKIVA